MAKPVRSFVKAISWRIIASLITLSAVWMVTGSLELGGFIGGIDFCVKLLAYYCHERFWSKIEWGRSYSHAPPEDYHVHQSNNSRYH